MMWLQDFIGELVLQENRAGTTSKTQSTTWKKGFLCFLLTSADDVLDDKIENYLSFRKRFSKKVRKYGKV